MGVVGVVEMIIVDYVTARMPQADAYVVVRNSVVRERIVIARRIKVDATAVVRYVIIRDVALIRTVEIKPYFHSAFS